MFISLLNWLQSPNHCKTTTTTKKFIQCSELQKNNHILSQESNHLYHSLKRFIFIFIYVYMRVSMHVFVMCLSSSKGKKRASDPLELKLYVFVSCPTWVLVTKFRSFERATHALIQWAISPTPSCTFKIPVPCIVSLLLNRLSVQLGGFGYHQGMCAIMYPYTHR